MPQEMLKGDPKLESIPAIDDNKQIGSRKVREEFKE